MVELVKQNFKQNKKKYLEVESKLKNNISNVTITHVGSTAIPNMYGKNIIDILIGVSKEDFENVATILEKLGYIPSYNSKTDIYQFFASTKEETKSGDVHIHLVVINTDRYNDFIILKNYLLKNKEEAKEYSDYKKKIIANGNNKREDYKKEKSIYVSKLLERAKR